MDGKTEKKPADFLRSKRYTGTQWNVVTYKVILLVNLPLLVRVFGVAVAPLHGHVAGPRVPESCTSALTSVYYLHVCMQSYIKVVYFGQEPVYRDTHPKRFPPVMHNTNPFLSIFFAPLLKTYILPFTFDFLYIFFPFPFPFKLVFLQRMVSPTPGKVFSEMQNPERSFHYDVVCCISRQRVNQLQYLQISGVLENILYYRKHGTGNSVHCTMLLIPAQDVHIGGWMGEGQFMIFLKVKQRPFLPLIF